MSPLLDSNFFSTVTILLTISYEIISFYRFRIVSQKEYRFRAKSPDLLISRIVSNV